MKKTIFSIMVLFLLAINIAAQQGGYALKFDGTDDYVEINTSSSLDITGNFALEVWVYPTALGENKCIVAKRQLWSTMDWEFFYNGSAGRLEFWYGNSGANRIFDALSGTGLSLNTWQHLAVSRNEDTWSLYINGALKGTESNSAIIPTGDNMIIGSIREGANGESYFNGKIDEVRIWNIARTEAEIKANMYKEIGTHANLKAYYKMSDGTGTSLTDNSGNSNTGTLINNSTWKISGCFSGSRQALDFDGTDDYVSLPSSFADAFDGLQKFSFCGWVYQTNLNTGLWGTYWTRYNSAYAFDRVTFHQLPNTVSEGNDVMISIATNTTYGEGWTTSNILESNKWIHLAVVFDGTQSTNEGKVKIYANGIQQSIYFNNTTFPTAISNPTTTIQYLGRYHNPDYFKGGKFDEFSFWNVTLNESEIRQIMFKSLAGNESGLFAYYRFDHADGTTLYDMTSSGHNGTLTNMEPATDWVSSTAFNTWLGGESTDWSTSANWSNGVPAAAQSAGIYNWSSALPNVTTYLPVLPATININNLQVPSGVSASGNVNLTATGSVFLGSSMTLDASALNTADNLIVESGKTLTLPTGGQLTVARQLDNQGSFIMQSGSSLITNGTITNSGTMQISRTVSESVWHLISIPVAGITANSFLGDYLQSWDETNGVWVNISDPLTALNTKQGYSLWATPGKSDATYTFTGTLLTGDQSTPITYHAVSGKEFDGANLLGNPYPSSIDWTQVSGYGAVYYWDGVAYLAYPAGTGGYGTGSQFIPPLQGFFIVVPDNDPSSFNLTNAMRTHNSATAYYKNENSLSDGIMIFADNGSYQDKLLIRFNNEATPDMDQERDAWKLPSNTPGISQLWSVSTDGNLAIDIRPDTGIVQLGFSNDQPGIYSIGLIEMADIANAALEDTKTGIFHNLQTGAYEFTWNPETDPETRFKLHVNSVGIEESPIGESNILIYAANGQIFIKGATNGEVMVSDVTGRVVLQQKIRGKETIAIPVNLQTGVYLVTVQNGKEVKTEKIFVK